MSLSSFTDKAADLVFRFVKPFDVPLAGSSDIIMDTLTIQRMSEYLNEFPVIDLTCPMSGSATKNAEMFLSNEDLSCSGHFQNENVLPFTNPRRTVIGSAKDILQNILSDENQRSSENFQHDLRKLAKDLSDYKFKEANFWLLYKFLCCLCLSEGRLDGNREFFRVFDDCMNISKQYTNVSSGSKAEGLDIPMGDYDIMTILNEIVVDKDGSEIELQKPMLYYDVNNSYPGFVQIKIPKGPFEKTLVFNWGVYSVEGPLLSNVRFKKYFMKKYRYRDIRLHGPCIASQRQADGTDHLFCLRSKSRLNIINCWVTRVESKHYSSKAVVEYIANQAVLFVPIGSKFDSKEDRPFEWRLSFSLLEKEIINSWNHTEILCYVFLKYLRKDLSKCSILKKALASYFIKTAMYWIKEETPQKIWRPCNILECLNTILNHLKYWLSQGFCPHYFIPENNLFESMDKDKLNTLAQIIDNLFRIMKTSTYRVHGISSADLYFIERYSKGYTFFHEKAIAISRNLQSIRITLQTCTLQQIHAIMNKSMYRYLKEKLSYYDKGLYLVIFCYANQIYCDKMSNKPLHNKCSYRYFKDIISHLLIGKNADAIAGWSLLAMFFIHWNSYRYCTKIVDFITEKGSNALKPVNLFTDNVHILQHFYDNPEIRWDKSKSFLTHMNSSCIEMLNFEQTSPWFLQELLADTQFNFHRVHPIIFGYFLKFVIANKQTNISLEEKAICSIIKENRENKIPGFYAEKISNYILLEVCYRLLGDKKAAEYWASHVRRYNAHLESPNFG